MKLVNVAIKAFKSYSDDPITAITPILNKGTVNTIFLVRTQNDQVIARLNSQRGYELNYRKETWCLEQAKRVGIPGPSVMTLGEIDGVSYMLQSFIPGENCEDCIVDNLYIWHKLGSYLKSISSIQTEGFGENLSDAHSGVFSSPLHDGFDGSWKGYLNYNINSLTADDYLLQIGVMSASKSEIIRQSFERLNSIQFKFGLCHGDISLKNAIISPDMRVYLLDWGSAGANITPFSDIIQVLHSNFKTDHPSSQEFRAFISGFGISTAEFSDMEPLFNSLLLLRTFDKVRWAIDQSPDKIKDFTNDARMIVQRTISRLL